MKRIREIYLVAMAMVMMVTTAWAVPVDEKLYFSKATTLTAGTHLLRFSLWDKASGGTAIPDMVWWEIKNMTLTSGAVSTYLGNVALPANRSGLIGDLDFSVQYWVQIDEVSGTPPAYTFTSVGTRTKLNIVPYAMHSITSETAAAGGSVNSVIAGSGLTETVSPAGDVTLNVGAGAGISVGADAVAIKAGGITNNMLATGAVTDAKITGPISGSKISLTGLNADKLDGLDSTDFVKKTGDTMTGPLKVEGPQDALHLTGYNPFLDFFDTNAGNARSRIQSAGGDLNLFTESYVNGSNPFAFIKLANNGNVGIGSSNPAGKLEIVGQDALRLVGYQPFMSFFDSGAGYAWSAIQSAYGEMVFLTSSYLNGSNGNGYVKLFNNGTLSVAQLIIRGGADLAEPFDVRNNEKIKPGMIVAIDPDEPGKLRLASTAYDKTVAGIVSGANGINPGMTMAQNGTIADGSMPVALTGRVYCMADSSKGAIRPGDLLTTSDIPGHAMKVSDFTKAQGAVIGKAMTGLDKGTGLILVLVTLQ